jgi:hypothetical protein
LANKAQKADALAAFATAIASPQTRQQLADNQMTVDQAIQGAGGNPGHLDSNVKTFLGERSKAELDLLSGMQATMTQAGLSDKTTSERTLAKF